MEGEGDYMGLRAVEIEFGTGCLADVGSPLKPTLEDVRDCTTIALFC